jgi:hypothetical protein
MKIISFSLVLLSTALCPALASADPEAAPAPAPANSLSVGAVAIGDADFEGAGAVLGGVSTRQYSATAGRTLCETPDFGLDLSLSYEGILFDPENENAAPIVKRLQSVTAALGFRRSLNEKWSLVGSLGAGCFNSGSRFDGDGAAFVGAVGALRRIGEKGSLVLGLSVNTLERDWRKVLPGVGFRYQFSPEWSLSLGYPETALSWKACECLTLSAVADGSFAVYHVRARDLRGNASGTVGSGRMEYDNFRLGLRAGLDLPHGFNVTAAAGWSLASRLDFFEQGYKLKSDGTSPYAALSLSAKF